MKGLPASKPKTAASTAEPQPPSTNQKVPTASTMSFLLRSIDDSPFVMCVRNTGVRNMGVRNLDVQSSDAESDCHMTDVTIVRCQRDRIVDAVHRGWRSAPAFMAT
ncbi:unannotated protein [freshwater metagenome]|uniref:Unannotated protein n=1 Tax=freshwater metagenome TaxID=449393 RepID=A0A6J7KLF7_9ZZZZ